jgi:hypothetical protein
MSTKTIHTFVMNLSDDSRLEIIKDHAVLEKNGSIGEGALRAQTENFLSCYNGNTGVFVLWMDILANAVYRFYAEKYLDSIESSKE